MPPAPSQRPVQDQRVRSRRCLERQFAPGPEYPRNLLAAIGLQVLRMLSGDRHGVDFPGARQIRPLAERTRTSPGAVLLCTQHCCLSRSRCSRLTGHVIAEPFISLHVHDSSGDDLEVD